MNKKDIFIEFLFEKYAQDSSSMKGQDSLVLQRTSNTIFYLQFNVLTTLLHVPLSERKKKPSHVSLESSESFIPQDQETAPEMNQRLSDIVKKEKIKKQQSPEDWKLDPELCRNFRFLSKVSLNFGKNSKDDKH